MIDGVDLEYRLRRTFDAVASTTRVGSAPRRAPRRAPGGFRAAVVVAAVIAAGLILLFTGRGHAPTGVRTETPANSAPHSTRVPTQLPSLLGFVTVGDEDGKPVGYVPQRIVHMPMKEYFAKVNARTMWPVTDSRGDIVGYIAPDVPFVPIAVVHQPGFDIEKVRAARNGGCEDQIGDPEFQQEFPRCTNNSAGR